MGGSDTYRWQCRCLLISTGRLQLQTRDAGRHIQASARLRTQRLESEVFGITTDENVCSKPETDRGTRRRSDISTRQSAVANACGRSVDNDPAQIGLAGDADVDAELPCSSR